MGLKDLLVKLIQSNCPRMVTLDKIHAAANSYGYKQSTAERILRKSKEDILPVKNEKGYIIGYKSK